MKNWHTLKIEDLAHELGTDLEKGLAPDEVSRRLEQYGPNELVERGVTSPWKILWEQLTGIMVVILIVSAVVSLVLKEYPDAIAILIIVVLNAALGFTQECRAEQAMAALKGISVQALVINQVIQPEVIEGYRFLQARASLQSRYQEEIDRRFASLMRTRLPLFDRDISNPDALREVGELLYGK